ncbi:MAG: YggT family protein [Roseiflexus sp.]|nr:YggT family protein [Roseiflexus sp.]MDW8145590.1 YggT family protein [Roseiflexaceae bacterium]MDW8232004.1 YggT family protein [Roseiflexaceae bacterium]
MAATIALGGAEGALVARFVLRLFAARPDNPVVQVVYAVTQPIIAPLRALDAGQPQYGATLEFATLVLLLVLPLITALMWKCVGNRSPDAARVSQEGGL